MQPRPIRDPEGKWAATRNMNVDVLDKWEFPGMLRAAFVTFSTPGDRPCGCWHAAALRGPPYKAARAGGAAVPFPKEMSSLSVRGPGKGRSLNRK